IGYEIKTEKDNLTRLVSQANNYSQVFDQAFIIVAEKHLQNAKKIIPDWWGIYLIKSINTETYSFIYDRKAQLLWKEEALEVANTLFKCGLKSNVTRQDIYEIISLKCKPKRLSKIVMCYLKKREGWRIA
ncbi:MAG: sce7726 family protein, partial [bacterium]